MMDAPVPLTVTVAAPAEVSPSITSKPVVGRFDVHVAASLSVTLPMRLSMLAFMSRVEPFAVITRESAMAVPWLPRMPANLADHPGGGQLRPPLVEPRYSRRPNPEGSAGKFFVPRL